MKNQTIAGALIALILLLLCIIGVLVWLLLTRNGNVHKQEIIIQKECPMNMVSTGAATNTDIPKYPQTNPSYPLRRAANDFQQIGTLTNKDDEQPVILPLFGRPLAGRNDRWEYYTTTDSQHPLRIPVEFEEKDCTEEIGCREIYNKDIVFIPSYQKSFSVTLYKYKEFTYSPN